MALQPKPYVIQPEGGSLRGAAKPVSIDWTQIAGYDAGEVQTLKNDNGSIEWVTDTP